jgi:hypothetical protein
MREFREAETTPFYRDTLEWIEAAQAESTCTLAVPERLPIEIQPTAAQAAGERATTAPQEVFLRLAGQFFDMEPAELRRRFEPMDEPRELDRVLGDRLDWDELRMAVALHSPAVQAARNRWQATLRQYEQAAYLEGLLTEYRSYTRYLNVETGEPRNREMAQAIVPYPGAGAFRGEMVRQAVRKAELEWQRALRDSVVEAGKAFFEYQYLHRAIATARENVATVEDLQSIIGEQFSVGESGLADLLRVETEVERQRTAAADFQAQARSSAAAINAALNRPANAPLGPPEGSDLRDLKIAAGSLLTVAMRNRQEIRMQDAMIAETEVAIRMAEVMSRPPATQGYSVFERGMMPEASAGESEMPFGARRIAPQPRPAFAQSEAYIAEMRQRLEADRAMLNEVEAETRRMAEEMMQEIDIARRKVRLVTDVVLPQSQSTYEIKLNNYMAGATTFIDLIETERALLEARLELHESRRDLNQALLRAVQVRGAF